MKKAFDIPADVRTCLSFLDPASVDWEGQKAMVVAAILNRGTWEAVRWVFQFYGESAIGDVVAHPQRGLWFPQALTFWLHYFGLTIDPISYQRALFRLAPEHPEETSPP